MFTLCCQEGSASRLAVGASSRPAEVYHLPLHFSRDLIGQSFDAPCRRL